MSLLKCRSVPTKIVAAVKAGLATMGIPDLDVVVTDDFVAKEHDRTEDGGYHDDRNGGSGAARTGRRVTNDESRRRDYLVPALTASKVTE